MNNQEKLFKAIKGNKYDIVEKILAENPENSGLVNAKDEFGLTPLHYAARNGYLNIVKLLIENGADINAKDDFGSTILCAAAWGGHLEIVKLLIENGADVRAKDEDEHTPLHLAAMKGHLDIVKFLIENGADVRAKNKYENNPLHFAVGNGKFNVTEFITKYMLIQDPSEVVEDLRLKLDYDKCKREVEEMQNEKIGNTGISLRTFLCATDITILPQRLFTRETLAENMDTYKSKYSEYAEIIEWQYNRVVERRELLDKADNVLNYISGAPKEITEKITCYLTNKDLNHIVKAGSADEASSSKVNTSLTDTRSENAEDKAPKKALENVISM